MKETENKMSIKVNGGGRVAWLDNLKAFAIFSVVFGHINGRIFSHGMPLFADVNLFIVAYSMPIFVFLSGYSNYKSMSKLENHKNYSKFLIKTSEHLLLPMLTFSIVTFIVLGELHFAWFLKMLFYLMATYSTLQLLGHYLKLADTILAAIFVVLMCLFNRSSTQELCTYFIVGMVSRKYDLLNKLNAIKWYKWLPLTIVLTFFSFNISEYYQFYDYDIQRLNNEGILHVWFFRQMTAILLIAIFVKIFISMLDVKFRIVTQIGQKTLGIYLFHGLIQDVMIRHGMKCVNESYYMWGAALISSILIMMICYYAIIVLEKNKITKYLFFGRR